VGQWSITAASTSSAWPIRRRYADARQLPLLPQCGQCADADGTGRSAGSGLGRRDRQWQWASFARARQRHRLRWKYSGDRPKERTVIGLLTVHVVAAPDYTGIVGLPHRVCAGGLRRDRSGLKGAEHFAHPLMSGSNAIHGLCCGRSDHHGRGHGTPSSSSASWPSSWPP